MASPLELRRGPPEFPGFRAASVWISSGTGLFREPTWLLPFPLTTPTVTEFGFSYGLPMAMASCPGMTLSESASRRGSMSAARSGSTCRMARSSALLLPRSVASRVRPSCRVTRTSPAMPTMWAFVTMCPSASTKNPDPLCWLNSWETPISTIAGLARSNTDVTCPSSNRAVGCVAPKDPHASASPRSIPKATRNIAPQIVSLTPCRSGEGGGDSCSVAWTSSSYIPATPRTERVLRHPFSIHARESGECWRPDNSAVRSCRWASALEVPVPPNLGGTYSALSALCGSTSKAPKSYVE